ncbi:RhoGAP-domain-containing protein [Metschnikowia bicuspidata var. bicuspidata NRRL YB-4993]|uniref:RhoGAP-domain-containing protein n=1 Tax=Metschnikowia bicuspidata var. bicuspidata NRRL YB-4993 TaxID=869754 RepID=A0A1A0HKJ6_9ASCO|nr:RhoGAP-domain-containing protein [Metschnikowia bicuspidata var. bicuspidata NRRL YB-4993]OBA24550.1 RhoGAP-domain-containing protein [Metschnikowia bicuspidata var. bicuspidata NRRL YB-4993]
MNQSGNRNSIFGWVKNLKRNALLNDSVNEIDDDLSGSESRSPSPAGGASEFLRPLLSHKSCSTNNVNSQPDSISRSLSNYDNSLGLRQRRDSFLQNNPLVDENSKYFGVPLEKAISQAAAKISILGSESSTLSDEDVLHYGRIPIVVAKCGVYLKNNGLNVEGIFRVGGSSKRIKELQIIFNSPPDFGKRLNWDGFTVHDAASVLRRYLNALPEPLIPLDLYEEFRDPLRSRLRIIKYLKYKANNSRKAPRRDLTSVAPAAVTGRSDSQSSPVNEQSFLTQKSQETQKENVFASHSVVKDNEKDAQARNISIPGDKGKKLSKLEPSKKPKSYKNLTRDVYSAIEDYKQLLGDLPSLSKQLLFYILDLLAMVQSFSNENLMSSRNLAAIFQPSILLHPSHDMDPEEYALSQSVVEFLIQYSYKLLPNSEPRQESSSASVESSSKQVAKPPSRDPSKRQHSKSLSAPNLEVDFIGYRATVKPMRSFALSDTDHDFVSASSEDEDGFGKHVIPTFHLFNARQSGQNEESAPSLQQLIEPAASREVPLVVLDDHK